ncbi:C2 domain-containing protein [Gamsiella multidivaricata]|uniref:C2 domain-containing protein n=1 Tax=Gamsiella multidivaricata TaxID=101098 RepID=UPI00221F2021|nr:C2 domain-containing protein [Gamsiella multidivaricata]KAG0367662.1 hypothetical protein BGZ54_003496 [Gamsiella multidivaricata]KAI7831405.1 C2 domain-containing protein [Gamsiella multidivaricata]
MTQSLIVNVHAANHLDDVEHFGKNDPYAQISLDFTNSHSFQKTSIKKNAGKDVEWNQTLTLDGFEPSVNHNLYVEVLDDEHTADSPIGFAAIPLRQVIDAPNHSLRAKYDIFTPNGKQKGTISLTISAVQPGQQAPASHGGPEHKGESQIVSDHQKRFKDLANKEKAADGASLAAGAALAVGAKFLLDQHKGDKKAQEAAREL